MFAVLDEIDLMASRKKPETSRRHTDNRIDFVIQPDLPSDNFRITAETPLPQAMTDDHQLVLTRSIIFGRKGAA
jgi:hypothetical protein